MNVLINNAIYVYDHQTYWPISELGLEPSAVYVSQVNRPHAVTLQNQLWFSVESISALDIRSLGEYV